MSRPQIRFTPVTAPKYVDPYAKAGSLFEKAMHSVASVGKELGERDYKGAEDSLKAALAAARTPEEAEAIKQQIISRDLPGSKYLQPGAAMQSVNDRAKALRDKELLDLRRKADIQKTEGDIDIHPDEQAIKEGMVTKQLDEIKGSTAFDKIIADPQYTIDKKPNYDAMYAAGIAAGIPDTVIQDKLATLRDTTGISREVAVTEAQSKATLNALTDVSLQKTANTEIINVIKKHSTMDDFGTTNVNWSEVLSEMATVPGKDGKPIKLTAAHITNAIGEYNKGLIAINDSYTNEQKQALYTQQAKFNSIAAKHLNEETGEYDINAIKKSAKHIDSTITSTGLERLSKLNITEIKNDVTRKQFEQTQANLIWESAHKKALKAAYVQENGKTIYKADLYLAGMREEGKIPDIKRATAEGEAVHQLATQKGRWAAIAEAGRRKVLDEVFSGVDRVIGIMKLADNDEAQEAQAALETIKTQMLNYKNKIAVQDFVSKGGVTELVTGLLTAGSPEWCGLDSFSPGGIKEFQKVFNAWNKKRGYISPSTEVIPDGSTTTTDWPAPSYLDNASPGYSDADAANAPLYYD